VPVGGTAERSVTGTRNWIAPAALTIDEPLNEPGPCMSPVRLTFCAAPGARLKLEGDCVKKLPFWVSVTLAETLERFGLELGRVRQVVLRSSSIERLVRRRANRTGGVRRPA